MTTTSTVAGREVEMGMELTSSRHVVSTPTAEVITLSTTLNTSDVELQSRSDVFLT